jgi:hypothetical protein
MLCLMKSPRVRDKLLTEIDQAILEHKIPFGLSEVITDSQARKLPYLQAVIKEVGPSSFSQMNKL